MDLYNFSRTDARLTVILILAHYNSRDKTNEYTKLQLQRSTISKNVFVYKHSHVTRFKKKRRRTGWPQPQARDGSMYQTVWH